MVERLMDNKYVMFGVMLTVFWSSYTIFTTPFEFYPGYIVVFSIILLYIRKFSVPPFFVFTFIYFLLTGLLNIYLGLNTSQQFFKVFLGVYFSYLFYYYVIKACNYNIKYLFELYLNGALIVCGIGFVQFISYQIHFNYGWDYQLYFNKWGTDTGGMFGIRINSILSEPSQYAAILSPAVFVGLINLFTKGVTYFYSKKQSWFVIVMFLLSFSSLGYIALFITLIVLAVNFGFLRYAILLIPVGLFLFFILYNYVEEVHIRFDSFSELFLNDHETMTAKEIASYHGSSFTLYDHYKVTLKNFSQNPVMGSGFGSHGYAYSKYSYTVGLERFKGLSLNSVDANSMLLRIISEEGIVGVVLVIFILFTGFVKRGKDVLHHEWVISGACLTIVLLYLLRQGHYFLNGFPLFVMMYVFNNEEVKKRKEQVRLEENKLRNEGKRVD